MGVSQRIKGDPIQKALYLHKYPNLKKQHIGYMIINIKCKKKSTYPLIPSQEGNHLKLPS
jgi:hypothetical protein